MAEKFHINPKTGRPGKCTAKTQCRFGGEANHFSSKAEAQKAIEKALESFVVPPSAKKPSKAATKKARETVREAVASCSSAPSLSCGSDSGASPRMSSSPPPTSLSCGSASLSC